MNPQLPIKTNYLGLSFTSCFVGIACGIFVVLPLLRPYGIPVAYISMFVVASIAYMKRVKLASQDRKLIITIIIIILYVTAYTVNVDLLSSIPLFVRTVSGFSIFYSLLVLIRNRADLISPVIGMSPIFLLDAIFGIGQYLGIPQATEFSLIFLSHDEDMVSVLSEANPFATRIWGLQGYAHIYGYTMALWSALLLIVLTTAKPRGLLRFYLSAVFCISLGATILCGQRTAVWPIVVFVFGYVLFSSYFSAKRIMLALLVGAVIFGSIVKTLDYQDTIERLASVGGVADDQRSESWSLAWKMIAEDPFFGTAFSVDSEVAIHNGFLRGWAEFGLLWLLAILGIFGLITKRILRNFRRHWQFTAGALFLVLLIFINSNFHTIMLTINDMISWCFLAFALRMISVPSRSSAHRVGSDFNSFRQY